MPYYVYPSIFFTGRINTLVVIDSDNSGGLKDHTVASVRYSRDGKHVEIWADKVAVTLVGPPDKPYAALIPVKPSILSAFPGGFLERLGFLLLAPFYLLFGGDRAGTGSLTGNLQKPHSPSPAGKDEAELPFQALNITALLGI